MRNLLRLSNFLFLVFFFFLSTCSANTEKKNLEQQKLLSTELEKLRNLQKNMIDSVNSLIKDLREIKKTLNSVDLTQDVNREKKYQVEYMTTLCDYWVGDLSDELDIFNSMASFSAAARVREQLQLYYQKRDSLKKEIRNNF